MPVLTDCAMKRAIHSLLKTFGYRVVCGAVYLGAGHRMLDVIAAPGAMFCGSARLRSSGMEVAYWMREVLRVKVT
jgi:hypothetical protein